jgi:hypothetical protein
LKSSRWFYVEGLIDSSTYSSYGVGVANAITRNNNMASDNQYTALGPAIVGFQTDGTNIQVGASIAGTKSGVTGISNVSPTGVGVQGEGVQFGVHGFAVVSTAANTPPSLGGASGVGVFGSSDSGTGVLGIGGSGIGVDANGGSGGVRAISNGGTGVSGVCLAIIRTPPDGSKPPLVNGFDGVFGGNQEGTGVHGDSQIGTGVNGHSAKGYGVDGASDSLYGGHFSGGLAQLQLEPAPGIVGHPSTGFHKAGELFVDGTGELFFCKKRGGAGVAVWVQLA